eukprot:scaffold2874_cov116-Isochrysis_galbana.AAC.6
MRGLVSAGLFLDARAGADACAPPDLSPPAAASSNPATAAAPSTPSPATASSTPRVALRKACAPSTTAAPADAGGKDCPSPSVSATTLAISVDSPATLPVAAIAPPAAPTPSSAPSTPPSPGATSCMNSLAFMPGGTHAATCRSEPGCHASPCFFLSLGLALSSRSWAASIFESTASTPTVSQLLSKASVRDR